MVVLISLAYAQNSSSHVLMNPSPNPPLNKGTCHIFYKTRICTRFMEGNCRNGENCTFAHGHQDLREPPPNWQQLVQKMDKGPTGDWNDDNRIIHRMKICRKFYNGEECPYGEKCNFLHESPLKFRTDIEMSRESSAISIGTVGPVVEQNGASDQQTELNKKLNPISDALRMKPVYWKTKLCSKWEATGQCPFGERCHFAHGQSGNIMVLAVIYYSFCVYVVTFTFTCCSHTGSDINIHSG